MKEDISFICPFLPGYWIIAAKNSEEKSKVSNSEKINQIEKGIFTADNSQTWNVQNKNSTNTKAKTNHEKHNEKKKKLIYGLDDVVSMNQKRTHLCPES